jgi:Na+/alanine symporter
MRSPRGARPSTRGSGLARECWAPVPAFRGHARSTTVVPTRSEPTASDSSALWPTALESLSIFSTAHPPGITTQRRHERQENADGSLRNQVVDALNGLLWGKILIWLLVGCGIWFTLRLGFIQVRHLGHTFTVLRGSRQSDASGISSFQALCTSLAARVGTGNIAGVAVAITLGGPARSSGCG